LELRGDNPYYYLRVPLQYFQAFASNKVNQMSVNYHFLIAKQNNNQNNTPGDEKLATKN